MWHSSCAKLSVLVILCLLRGITGQALPVVTPSELFNPIGGGPFTVSCKASFATEDQIQWIKLNSADFEAFQMASSTECVSAISSGGGSGDGDKGSIGNALGPSSGSGNMLGSGSGSVTNSTASPMLPSFLANGSVVTMGSNLTFNSTNFGDEGYYVCVVSLPDRICYSENFSLTVSPGDLSVNATPFNVANYTDDVNLTCSARGGPNNVYQWLRNGMNTTIGSQPTLSLYLVDASEGGEYTCVVSNAAGISNASLTLYILPYIVTHPPRQVLATVPESVSFTCEASGFPAPSYRWDKIGDPGFKRFTQNLTFDPVNFSNAGFYQCVASIMVDMINYTAESNQGELILTPGEVMIDASPSNVGVLNENVTLTCSASGGIYNFQWQRNGINLPGETQSTLFLTSVNASDGGEYTCVVGNPAGNSSTNFTLYIHPYIVTNPQRQLLRAVASSATFTCEAFAFPAPGYRWDKVGDVGFDNLDRFRQNFTFSRIAFGNEGNYICFASITVNKTNYTAQSEPGELILSPESSVSITPNMSRNVQGDTPRFTCSAMGGSGNMFSWTRLYDNTIVGDTSDLTVNVNGATDGGQYRCEVSNLAGNDSDNTTVNVGPIIDTPPLSVNVSISDSSTLTCVASGFPVPTIIWVHNGTQIRDDENRTTVLYAMVDRSVTSTLTINMAMVNDSGEYVCNASSPDYDDVSTDPINLSVQATPERPQNVTAVEVTTTSVILEWVEPHDNNAPIRGYKVSYTLPSFLEGTGVTINSNVETVNITGLHPGVAYVFSVVAFNEIGDSAPGNVTVTTVESVPTNAPENIMITVLSSTEIQVNWTEVPMINRNGIITTYEVMYEPLMTFDELTAARVNTTNVSTVLTGLEENLEYNVSVRAYTSVGSGPYSVGIVGRTFEDVPSSSPSNVSAMAVSSTMISVVWQEVTAIDRNGNITRYEVMYNGGFDVMNQSNFTDGNTQSFIITGLDEFANYTISVRAYTSVGPGPYSPIALVTTDEDTPAGPPQNVMTTVLSSTEIQVNWTEVSEIDQNGMIITYEVLYDPLMTFNGMLNTTTVNTTNVYITLSNLQEYVEYNISVRAYTSVGPGPYSPIALVTTDEDTPASPPQNVTTTVLSSTEIQVNWTKVSEIDQNGMIITYEVLYDPLMTFNGMLNTTTVNTINVYITLSNLQEYVEYNISVRAYTNVGPGPYSLEIISRTLENAPSGSPTIDRVVSLSPTEIQVTWTAVPEIEQNGVITQYEVFYKSTFDFTNGSVFTMDGTFTANITELEEFVVYNITVRAYTSIGPGPFSEVAMESTGGAAPASPPQNVAATVLSSTKIQVNWTEVPEIDQNGIITEYEVMYEPQMTFGVLSTSTARTMDVFFLLIGLKEYVEYNISVRAYTNDGAGPYSVGIIRRTFEDVPSSPPSDVNTISVSSTEISVTWEEVPAIDRNGKITVYEVTYNGDFDVAKQSNFINSSMQNFSITGLDEFSEYNISVRAYTSVGPGPYSPVEMEMTEEDVPASPPQNVTTSVLSSTEIQVNWTVIPEMDQNGIITEYEVMYEPLMTFGGVLTTRTVNTTNMSITLSGLQEYVQYNISVRAYTSVGPGPYSQAERGITEEDVPASPPQNVTTSVLSSTEIQVNWTEIQEIEQNGIITEYEVMYEPLMTFGGVLTTTTVNTTNMSVTLTGLQEYVEYNISVRAYTNIGPGPYSVEIVRRTLEDVPGSSPRNLQVIVAGPTSLSVSWEPPVEMNINGILTNYTIEYYITEEQNSTHDIIMASSETFTIVLENLNNFTVYNVSVSANTVIGRGPITEMTQRTEENVPGEAPQNVTVNSESSTSIRVEWDPPREDFQFGIIRSYIVLYRVTMETGSGEMINVVNRSLIIDRLMEFTNYSVEVTAVTVGEGPYSDPVTVITDQDIPGVVARPPDNQSVISAFSANVSWTPPVDPNGIITQYTVNYFIVSNDAMNTRRRRQASGPTVIDPVCVVGGMENINRNITVTGNPPPTFVILENLTPYTVYEFRVQAETSVGTGDFSLPRSFSTPEDVPTEPRSLSVQILSSTSFEVTWESPQCNFGSRTGYNVSHDPILGTFEPLGTFGTLSNPSIQSDSNAVSITITGLSSFTNYTVSICALTSAGCGNISSNNAQTDEDAPDPVSNLGIISTRRNGSSIRVTIMVTWSGPSGRNGPYRYMLNYTADQSSPYPVTRSISTSSSSINVEGNDQSYSVPINDSLPFADFTASLYAFNIRRGAGVKSAVMSRTEKTTSIEPTSVLNLVGTTTSHQSFRVSWDVPQFPNSEITNYTIYYTVASTTQGVPINDSGYTFVNQITDMAYDVTNLDPFTNYTVHVRAIGNLNLQGSVVEEILVRTNITNPSAVVNLTADAISSTEIRVTWNAPTKPNGPISHYVVYYLEGSTPQTGNISSFGYTQLTTTGTMFTIQQLDPYTYYQIHVQPFVTETPYVLDGMIDNETMSRTFSAVPDFTPTPGQVITAEPTHSVIHILIPNPMQINTGQVIFVAVVVVKNPPADFDQTRYTSNRPYSSNQPETDYITAAWNGSQIQAGVPSSLNVGDGTTKVVDGITYTNINLDSNTLYAVFVRFDIDADDDLPLYVYSEILMTKTALPFSVPGLVIGIFIIAVIVAVVIVAIIFFMRYRNRRGLLEIHSAGTASQGLSLQDTSVSKRAEAAQPVSFSNIIENPFTAQQHTGTHDPIKVANFPNHVRNLHANDDYLFTEEYSNVEPDHSPTTEATRRPVNISKNRYANITAYDHSRVKLQVIPDEDGSDYINANFMDGYRSTNALIAAQGPVPSSLADFWRMVWEQGAATIVMVTNLEEKGRVKCHKYWPDDKPVVHGDIRIQCQETLSLADYVIRTFSLTRPNSKEERIIRQYHYTVWPDHGVPEYPTSLLHFVRKVTSTNPTNAGPIVVHCSAGVGRTGTFITLFAQLKQIKVENCVDVFGFVHSMRRRRCYMVQTEPQYIFLHDALLEAIECGITEVPARDLLKQYRKLGSIEPGNEDTGLAIEFKKLKSTIHFRITNSVGTLPTSKKKNRYTDTLPYDKSRCRLSTIPGETGSDYINASHINGYHKRNAFIATQGPLPDTSDDFWRMVWEQNCATIVMLTKEREGGKAKCHRYWPESGAASFAYLQVILHAVNEYPDYILRELKIVDTRDGSSLPVKHFQYTGWPEEGVPDSGSGFIDLIGQVQKWQRSSGDKPIVAHCSGGTGRTGTFIAVSILLERLKTEGMVDVFQTVRALRLQRPGMVRAVPQYEFCYKTILEFLESFELYSNFK